MSNKYYLDSAIWRDLHEGREDRFRPLGEWAFELLRKIRISRDKVIYSKLIVDELSVAYDKETITKLFQNTTEMLQRVEINENQVREAARLSKKYNIPFGDALHGILARDNDAIMVTRDHHFEKLNNIVSVKKPEDLI
jgi:predicted nucleic acid-binding protein